MKKSQKGFLLPLLAIILLVLIGGGTYLFLKTKSPVASVVSMQSSSIPVYKISIASSSISGWKTYTNNIYSYKIDYPDNASTSFADPVWINIIVPVVNGSISILICDEFVADMCATYGPGYDQIHSSGTITADGKMLGTDVFSNNQETHSFADIDGLGIEYDASVDYGKSPASVSDMDMTVAIALAQKIISTFHITKSYIGIRALPTNFIGMAKPFLWPKTLEITWDSSQDIAQYPVSIYWEKPVGVNVPPDISIIATSTPNTGSYDWITPASMPSGFYYVVIRSSAPVDVFGTSSVFRVDDPSTFVSIASLSTTSTQVGQSVTLYGTNLVGATNYIWIDLNSSNNWHIVPDYVSTTSITFTIPQGVSIGNHTIGLSTTPSGYGLPLKITQ